MHCPFASLWPRVVITATVAAAASALLGAEPETERRYLSGHGPKDAVPWEFTVTGGRRAGEKTTIPVPSNWELHGFGEYHYGQQRVKSDEHGLYRTGFAVPPEWKGRRIWLVFDGVMTDAAVKVNGRAAGPVHQGGFYRFRYDITGLVQPGGAGGNTLEVDVAKVSANPETERAERGGDYWVFGGIHRPVWLEAAPAQAIDHVAVDARADGTLTADVALAAVRDADRIDAEVRDAAGRMLGSPFTAPVPGGGAGRLRLAGRFGSPRLWTAETPNRYTLRLALRRGDETLHVVERRFGFRTFEVREGRGLFLNGQRILLKGVNRHSFRPETGRALNPEDCYADVRLIRGMNMNAVRMSHYPPDEVFLDACDELGLYVLDELSGWQRAHGTAIGRLLVRELVERDVNHPSILCWDNGNEGGWNRDLDGEFALHDPQRRPVLHPWELHDAVNTKHYTNYEVHAGLLRGRDLVMPTEILHGMYDGGGGAGLDDYWKAIIASPVGAGAFIWVYADEGVVRTDQNGRIDVFSTFAPDGIVGPHLEKEGSFFTIREVWCPVQISPPRLDEKFDGRLPVRNGYDFTSTESCRFEWTLIAFDVAGMMSRAQPAGAVPAPYQRILATGTAASPGIAPHDSGTLALALPDSWREADALAVTVRAPSGEELWTWIWPTPTLARSVAKAAAPKPSAGQAAAVERTSEDIRLVAGDVAASFDPASGMLRGVRRGGAAFALQSGPRLTFTRPAKDAKDEWRAFVEPGDVPGVRRLSGPALANVVEIELEDLRGPDAVAGLTLELSADGGTWTTIFDATRRPQDGARYEFPPQIVTAVRLENLRRFDGRPPVLKTFRVGYDPTRFPASVAAPAEISTGTGAGSTVAWLEARGGPSGLERLRWTMNGDGSLQLDYGYSLQGSFAQFGVTFDHPLDAIPSFRWLGEGPYRVWQNRVRGTTLGMHEHTGQVRQPGETWIYPEFEGYFGGFRCARLATDAGPIAVAALTDGLHLRVGTPRITAATTTVDFPAGDVSFVNAIPAMGSKNKPPEFAGPASQWAVANGRYEGTLIFRFGDR